jgi:streptogramin lyase
MMRNTYHDCRGFAMVRENRGTKRSWVISGSARIVSDAELWPSGIFVSVQERFKMRNKLLVLAFSALITAGCSNHQALPSLAGAGQTTQGHNGVGPDVRQSGEQPVNWRRFSWGAVNAPYYPTIITGADGNLWYDDYSGTQLIRMGMLGFTKQFPLPSFNPTSLAVGSDSKFYLGDVNLSSIDVVNTAGVVNQIGLPNSDKIGYDEITLGPDGNVWFMQYAHVGKITPGGTVTDYAYHDASTNNYLGSITTGPDGNVWAAQYFTGNLNKIIPGTGAMTVFALGCNPQGMVSAHGNLYVACTSNNLLQVTTAGVITTFYNGFGFPGSGKYMTVGPDGNPWFGTNTGSLIGKFDTTNNAITYFYPPVNYGIENALTSGPDGNIWTVDSSSRAVAIYILNVISASPANMTFTAGGQNQTAIVTEPGTSAWTATSSKTSVATVTQGSPASHFTVHSVATGTAKIIVTDAVGNSFAVRVTVQ